MHLHPRNDGVRGKGKKKEMKKKDDGSDVRGRTDWQTDDATDDHT